MQIEDNKKAGFYHGKYNKSENIKGWFVGSFLEEGNPCRTSHLEMAYKEHKPGDIIPKHYHKQKVELVIIIEGKAIYLVNNTPVTLNKGDFIFIDPNNTIEVKYAEPTKILAIHSPSIPTDKIIV